MSDTTEPKITFASTTPDTTTEADHLRLLRDALGAVIADCVLLAQLPAQGPTYERFRQRIKEIEQSCARVVFDRADGRWSAIPLILGQIHQQCGDWIRGHHPREKFLFLAEMMRQLERHIDDLQHRATGRIGAIVAKPLRHDRMQGRPVQVMTPGGIIIPEGVAA